MRGEGKADVYSLLAIRGEERMNAFQKLAPAILIFLLPAMRGVP
jgi:hypothetical protein